MQDFDLKIKMFIDHWENKVFNGEDQFIAKSISFRITDLLYGNLEGNKKLFSLSNRNQKHTSCKLTIIHYFYYVLWSIKWIVFKIIFIRIVKNIILFNLMPQRKTSRDYILKILNHNKNDYALNFSIIHDKLLLLNPRVFCIPIGFSYRFEKFDNSKIESIFDVLRKLCLSDFKIELPKYLKDEITKSYKFQNLFKRFLDKSLMKKANSFYSDYDFMSINRLLVLNINQLNILTFSIDHAIFFYDHLFTKRESKNFLTWGEYSTQWLKQNADIKETHIKNYGIKIEEIEEQVPNVTSKKQWLYLSQSYFRPIQMISSRTFEKHSSMSKQLLSIAKKENWKREFKLILHPKDYKNINYYNNFDVGLLDISLLKNVELIFFEDTSFVFQFFKWNVPLIYIDSNKSLPIKDVLRKVSFFLNEDQDYEAQILEVLKMNINIKSRQEALNYFFTPQVL